ncbi:MAG: TIM barrel protein [Verrucomicrobiales bacterium]|nr:TIM barrel protein [Verrucomicrobiales bacterium]
MSAFHIFSISAFLLTLPIHASEPPQNLRTGNLVAWCIVPFDASKRSPEQRAAMLAGLGLKHSAYDWRAEHVPTFEREILAYRKHDITFTAFWDTHPDAIALFKKHNLSPQLWKTAPSPDAPDQPTKIKLAADALAPIAVQAASIGSKLGLYNHGGWGGEPGNLVAVAQELHRRGHHNVGIVYNLHHAHHRVKTFAADLKLLSPHLLCLNLNGTNTPPQPKILPLGQGQHDSSLLKIILSSSYTGPVGILDHRSDTDTKTALQQNLTGLKSLLSE